VHVHEHGEEELDAVRLCSRPKFGLNVWHVTLRRIVAVRDGLQYLTEPAEAGQQPLQPLRKISARVDIVYLYDTML
jgi:hypothetical protein